MARVPALRALPAAVCLITLFASASPSEETRSAVDRLKESHLEAVHQARVKWMRDRVVHPQLGIYNDYRAVIHVHAEDAAHTLGTREQELQGAKDAGVDIVMSTDHGRPKPDAWRGFHGRILFIAGAESDHQLQFPDKDDPLRFLSHVEEVPDASSEGFQGMEIYNRHADAKLHRDLMEYIEKAKDSSRQWRKLASLQKQYPDEVFGAGMGQLPQYLARWDAEIEKHAFTGIAANDSHRNQVFKKVVFDPYDVSFRSVSTHILALELTEPEVRKSLRDGHVYVAHDWLCDPAGFSFVAMNSLGVFEMGDRAPMARHTKLMARFPVSASIRLIHKGQIVARKEGGDFEFTPAEPGPYRLEAWLKVDGEERPWIYSNPIYLAAPDASTLALPPSGLSANVKAVGDIPYAAGKPEDADKHQLDLYLPSGAKNFPVLFFVHGGSWNSGDRRQYAALGNRFAKEGIGVVVPSYRLAPANPPPAQIADVASAFAWTVQGIEKYGGDRHRIFVAGHSAGGQLAALLALNPQYLASHHLKPTDIRGVIGISGAYDVRNLPLFGRAEGKTESPLEYADHSAPPFLIAYAQWDYPYLPRQARALDAALRSHFTPSTLKFLPKRNHISEIVNIWKDDDPLAQAIIGFVRSAN